MFCHPARTIAIFMYIDPKIALWYSFRSLSLMSTRQREGLTPDREVKSMKGSLMLHSYEIPRGSSDIRRFKIGRKSSSYEAMEEIAKLVAASSDTEEAHLQLDDGITAHLRGDSPVLLLGDDIVRAQLFGMLTVVGPYPTQPNDEQCRLEEELARHMRGMAAAQRALTSYMSRGDNIDMRTAQQNTPPGS